MTNALICVPCARPMAGFAMMDLTLVGGTLYYSDSYTCLECGIWIRTNFTKVEPDGERHAIKAHGAPLIVEGEVDP